jgi:hypothetical protein
VRIVLVALVVAVLGVVAGSQARGGTDVGAVCANAPSRWERPGKAVPQGVYVTIKAPRTIRPHVYGSISVTLVNHSGETVGAWTGSARTADYALVNNAGRAVYRASENSLYAGSPMGYAVEPLASKTARLAFYLSENVAPGRYILCAWFARLAAYVHKTVEVPELQN